MDWSFGRSIRSIELKIFEVYKKHGGLSWSGFGFRFGFGFGFGFGHSLAHFSYACKNGLFNGSHGIDFRYFL